jgi:hypothetical protein
LRRPPSPRPLPLRLRRRAAMEAGEEPEEGEEAAERARRLRDEAAAASRIMSDASSTPKCVSWYGLTAASAASRAAHACGVGVLRCC